MQDSWVGLAFFLSLSLSFSLSLSLSLSLGAPLRPPSMKPGAESPVIYDFIPRYTIRSYLKVEAFFTPAVQATLNDRISTVSESPSPSRVRAAIVNTRYRRQLMNVSSAAKKGAPRRRRLRTIAMYR